MIPASNDPPRTEVSFSSSSSLEVSEEWKNELFLISLIRMRALTHILEVDVQVDGQLSRHNVRAEGCVEKNLFHGYDGATEPRF